MADASIHPSKARVIDWYRAITLTTITVVIGLFIFISAATSQPPHLRGGAELWSIAVSIALWLGWVHFGGAAFDVTQNTLTFPTVLFRRSVRLSEIRDANVANLARKFRGNRTTTRWIYAVDLSGDFGGRQVKFWSRKRRDQFLSDLRHLCPKCRITRWAGGYGPY